MPKSIAHSIFYASLLHKKMRNILTYCTLPTTHSLHKSASLHNYYARIPSDLRVNLLFKFECLLKIKITKPSSSNHSLQRITRFCNIKHMNWCCWMWQFQSEGFCFGYSNWLKGLLNTTFVFFRDFDFSFDFKCWCH